MDAIARLLFQFCQWVDGTHLAYVLRHSSWMFDVLDLIHTLGIVLVAGTIVLVDLRLVGLGVRRAQVSAVVGRIVPWTLSGFGLMFVTGGLLFCSEAVKMYHSGAFRLKLVLLAAAGLNALVFHRTIYRQAAEWDGETALPWRARLAGFASLLLWMGIIVAGRAIAYGPGYDVD
ncbi:MAG TPA: DUF6644 family protein [Bryobacteraceae bacterium]|nr:DUF6644 family protein [Bryobacteraceae bacterium]